MSTAKPPRRRLCALHAVALLVLCVLAAPPAYAGALEDAEASYESGRSDAARAELTKWLFDDPDDADDLLRAVELARRLQDLDLLGLVRAAGERLEEDGKADVQLDLALGFAYLGLAEENLRRRTSSSSVSLYFADALARAANVPPGQAMGAAALRLAAETYYAKGDTEAALRAIEARTHELASGPDAQLNAFRGKLRYERGVAGGTDASGRPTDAARKDFDAAIGALKAAIDADTLRGTALLQVHLQRAWVHHRMGQYDAAIASYHAAHAPGTRQGVLALRGLESLLGRDPKRLASELAKVVAAHPDDARATALLIQSHLRARNVGAALALAHAGLEQAPDDPGALYTVGRVLQLGGMPEGAKRYFVQVLERAPDDLRASSGIEQLARGYLAKEPKRTLALYEELLALRPTSPYVRNNYGFILRDLVTPHTNVGHGALQRIKPGAPPEVRKMLQRCVEVYAEAAALIDPKDDGSREELEAWNLAGIVNDYGLILHYFLDVQDAELAEQQYLRALRMTDHGFKDTYSPNLQRLYSTVLTDRTWTWYRLAREAQDAILLEARDEQGRLRLAPDERKREAARRDMLATRARILQTLKMDAGEDGLPWPPGKETGNDR